jgi:hypothetical protein
MTTRSWRNVIAIHPAAELLPLMSEAQLRELGEDIKKNGLRAPICTYRGALLDGRNRLDAMEFVGIDVLNAQGDNFAHGIHVHAAHPVRDDPYDFVLSANIHRRHLTSEQKRDLIAKVIKAKPELSNRQVAAKTATSHPFVGKVRGKLEQSGDVETVSTSIDTRGRKQPARKAVPAKSATPSEELTGWAKVKADQAEQWEVPVGGMPDLPPELDRRAERENQVPVEREVQGLPPVEPKTDWGLVAALVADFVRDHIKDKFKIFPPEHHASLLRKVRQAINQLDKERKAADLLDEAAS